MPRGGAHKKNLLSIKVDILGVYSFNFNVFNLVFVAKSIFEVRKYGFVAHMLTWPTRVRGTLHVSYSYTNDILSMHRTPSRSYKDRVFLISVTGR